MIGRPFKHGLRYTAEYRAWVQMRQRCTNKNRKDYEHYGGRGISVCSEWDNSVEHFVKDMGFKPSDEYELDRRDNNLCYSKDNCRWVKKELQMQNTSISKWWFIEGVRYKSLSDASKKTGLLISTVKRWCDGRSDGGYIYPPKNNCWSEIKYDRCSV